MLWIIKIWKCGLLVAKAECFMSMLLSLSEMKNLESGKNLNLKMIINHYVCTMNVILT